VPSALPGPPYYRHEWVTFLRSALAMVAAGFGSGRLRTLRGAWHVLRANHAWAPYPDNQPDQARAHMRRFYQLETGAFQASFGSGQLGMLARRPAGAKVSWSLGWGPARPALAGRPLGVGGPAL